MLLYIVRHDRAVEWGGGRGDALRHLTAKGRSRFRETARAARDAGMSAGLIVTSPLVRAVQTADILAEGIGYEGEVVADPILATGPSRSGLPGFLEQYEGRRSIALVGHNPQLTGLVADLFSLDGEFCMKKGAIVAAELSPERSRKGARFLWMLVDGKQAIPAGIKIG
jgi:phosphohistidine phosphatase